MQSISLVDVRPRGLRHLVDLYPDRTKELIAASRRTLGLISDLIACVALPCGDRVSRNWLIRTQNPYLDEIDYCAAKLNLAGVYALNLCFEWGCTSSVYAKEDGPTLTRVLDWSFPKIGENITVAHQNGEAGEFYSVTWPGLSGVFQGMAPGKFSAALNQAPMQRHGHPYIGDWIKNRRNMFHGSGLPPAHLLRKVFEGARNYDEAKQRLCQSPVALPVIYVLAGREQGEGCVIERIENDFAILPMEGERVCASNQFETRLNSVGRRWQPRPIDSMGRVQQARTLPLAMINEGFDWFKPPIANSHSRLVMSACASIGRLSVFGTRGVTPVTHIFPLG